MRLTGCFSVVLATVSFFAPVYAFAEEQNETRPKTLFDAIPNEDLGAYGGLEVRNTRVLGENADLGCAEGAMLLDHHWSVGLLGCGLANIIKTDKFGGDEKKNLKMGYGGINVRYDLMPLEVVHVAVGGTLGTGSFGEKRDCCDSDDEDKQKKCEKEKTSSRMTIIEPEVVVYTNVIKWMRVGVNAGYRIAAGVKADGFKNRDFSAPFAGMSVQFGKF